MESTDLYVSAVFIIDLSRLTCVFLVLLYSAYAEKLLALAQTAAIVFLILHYRGDTLRGTGTFFQLRIPNDLYCFKITRASLSFFSQCQEI